jgi:hypothetical protein
MNELGMDTPTRKLLLFHDPAHTRIGYGNVLILTPCVTTLAK